MFTADIKKYIHQSVLCWLATCDTDNFPNVSPKEMFAFSDDNTLLIAHLASPISIENIKHNPKVSVSFIDIFLQKGYKLKGIASIIYKEDLEFDIKVKPLTDLFTDEFPIKALIEISVTKIDVIQAPRYFLYPETTEESQINNAMKTYNVIKE